MQLAVSFKYLLDGVSTQITSLNVHTVANTANLKLLVGLWEFIDVFRLYLAVKSKDHRENIVTRTIHKM